MGDLLDSYESEFQELTFAVSQRIQQIPKMTGNQKVSEVDAAESEIQEAERILQTMNLRIRSINAKETLVSRIRGYGDEVGRLKKELKKARVAFGEADRQRLLGEGREVSVADLDHRTALLRDVEKAEQTSEVIRDIEKEARMGLELGVGIVNNLDEQENLMKRMRDRLQNINELVSQSRKIMNLMWRRMLENKLITAGIALALLLMIAFVIWIKWIHNPGGGGGGGGSTPTTAPTPTGTNSTALY